MSLGVSGHASQQQFLLPVHELVGEAVTATTQLLSHIGSLEGDKREVYHSRPWLWVTVGPWAGTTKNHACHGVCNLECR